MIEPKLEGSQGCSNLVSSPLDFLLVGVPPGACKSQPLQFSGLRGACMVEHGKVR